MTSPTQRETIVNLIHEATAAGARQSRACQIVGISERTLQRWQPQGETVVREDQRPHAQHPSPANKLSAEEYQQVLTICNQPEYASLPPSQIVPKLADQGIYIASESTIYRALRAEKQMNHHGRAQAPQASRQPTTHIATCPQRSVGLGYQLFAQHRHRTLLLPVHGRRPLQPLRRGVGSA